LVQLRWNPNGLHAPFLDGKISGYSSTLPEKLGDDEEVNP